VEARSTERPVRVFISYAHGSAEHMEQVRELWLLLRTYGVDARLDLSAAETPQDWALWMIEQVREADYVLVIASAAYRRRAEGLALPQESRGVVFESGLVREALYADPTAARRKFLPVLLAGSRLEDIPAFLGPTSTTHYRIAAPTPENAEPLLRLLTGRSLPELGPGTPGGAVAMMPAAQLASTPGPLAPRPAGPQFAGVSSAPSAGRLTIRDLADLVDGLLAISEIGAPAQWQQLLDLLPSYVTHAVPRQSAGRAEAIALLKTCQNYPGAWAALVEALCLTSPHSPAVQQFAATVRLLQLDQD